jgi:RNA polymerase sigma-70 factor (ECF subfamily)
MTDDPGYLNIHQEYIDRCRKGDHKAQFEIYRLYYKSMYNTSLRIVKDYQDAEDIMQESFLSAFIKINTYSGKVSFGAWLKKIVINNSLDALKKKKILTQELNEDLPEKVIKEEEGEEDFANIRIEDIKDEIFKLPDGYRIVLSLHLLEGYDHEEIAEILHISSSTSRSQFTRAKQKLLTILKEKKKLYGES